MVSQLHSFSFFIPRQHMYCLQALRDRKHYSTSKEEVRKKKRTSRIWYQKESKKVRVPNSLRPLLFGWSNTSHRFLPFFDSLIVLVKSLIRKRRSFGNLHFWKMVLIKQDPWFGFRNVGFGCFFNLEIWIWLVFWESTFEFGWFFGNLPLDLVDFHKICFWIWIGSWICSVWFCRLLHCSQRITSQASVWWTTNQRHRQLANHVKIKLLQFFQNKLFVVPPTYRNTATRTS